MPTETFERTITTSAGPDGAWATLTDVATLVSWISIVHDAVEVSPLERYQAVLQDSIGPFKLKADLDITLSEVHTNQSLRITANGEDRQVSSRISIDAVMELSPADDGTRIRIAGKYAVVGKVANMGSGMINKKAKKVLDEFFAAAGAAL